MKNCSIIGLLISVVLLVSGCASKTINFNSANLELQKDGDIKVSNEQIVQGYIEKFAIRNEMVVDCPTEVMALRENVEYGKVEHVKYHSNTCKMDRYFSILLPAGYNPEGEKKYPVVYFQHGIFGDENCMINDKENKIKEITGNLFADGNAKEMIVVFGNMYAADNPDIKPAFTAEAVIPYDNFINELTQDLMPYIESHYKVLTGRENTAIWGFSMGGRETLYIGLKRPDLFGYIGAVAPAPGIVATKDKMMVHTGMLKEEEVCFSEGAVLPEVLMVCCGTNDSVVGQYPKSYHNLFEKNGVDHIWFEVMNADHNAHAVRSGFYLHLV